MQQPTFIRIENTFEDAMQYRNSPQMQYYSFEGLQLLPNNPLPYVQRTYASDGIILEDFDVYVMSICGEQLQTISAYFDVLDNFQDPNTGKPQIHWRLLNVPYDFGGQLIYLKIRSGDNTYLYTNPFYITNDGAEYTSRWDYRNRITDRMLSTQLKVWFKQYDEQETLETYDTVTHGRRVTVSSSLIEYEVWQFGIVEYTLNRLFKQMRRNTFVYCDLVKTIPFEPYDTPRMQGFENFGEAEISLCRDYDNTYNPLALPIVPPVIPATPSITLLSVTPTGTNSIQYSFEYEDFSPSSFIFEWSLDQLEWNGVGSGIEGPITISGIDDVLNNNYYYRIKNDPLHLFSNILQLPVRALVLDNVDGNDSAFHISGNKYIMYWHGENITVNSLRFEASHDNVNWVTLYYGGNPTVIASPKSVNTPSSTSEFTYFRVKSDELGLISNVIEFEI